MNIYENINKKMKLKPTKMNCDHILAKDFEQSLASFRSGFCMALIGPSGSGKTSYLCSLMKQGRVDGLRLGFRNVFSNICIVSPSMHTIEDNPFEDIDEEWKYDELTVDTIENFQLMCEEAKIEAENNDEERGFNLLILDDCSSSFKDKDISKAFRKLVANRRHSFDCSIIFISQYTKDIPKPIRSNLSHLVCFKPKALSEEEALYEFVSKKKKFMNEFFDFVFREPHDTLFSLLI
jgi:hypothetical protein